jgi:hypothetical protein
MNAGPASGPAPLLDGPDRVVLGGEQRESRPQRRRHLRIDRRAAPQDSHDRHLEPGPVRMDRPMSDPLLAQSAVDRLVATTYELVIEGESYRRRQRPQHAVNGVSH